jgi:cold shock protein
MYDSSIIFPKPSLIGFVRWLLSLMTNRKVVRQRQERAQLAVIEFQKYVIEVSLSESSYELGKHKLSRIGIRRFFGEWFWMLRYGVGKSREGHHIQGTVWFNTEKGYGFIQREGGSDVFVNYSAIRGSRRRDLYEGDLTDFEDIEGQKGQQASDVALPEESPVSVSEQSDEDK